MYQRPDLLRAFLSLWESPEQAVEPVVGGPAPVRPFEGSLPVAVDLESTLRLEANDLAYPLSSIKPARTPLAPVRPRSRAIAVATSQRARSSSTLILLLIEEASPRSRKLRHPRRRTRCWKTRSLSLSPPLARLVASHARRSTLAPLIMDETGESESVQLKIQTRSDPSGSPAPARAKAAPSERSLLIQVGHVSSHP